VHGNFFLSLRIGFLALRPEVQETLHGLLPSPLNRLTFSNEDAGVYTIEDTDPAQSYSSNKADLAWGSEAYDNDDDDSRGQFSFLIANAAAGHGLYKGSLQPSHLGIVNDVRFNFFPLVRLSTSRSNHGRILHLQTFPPRSW